MKTFGDDADAARMRLVADKEMQGYPGAGIERIKREDTRYADGFDTSEIDAVFGTPQAAERTRLRPTGFSLRRPLYIDLERLARTRDEKIGTVVRKILLHEIANASRPKAIGDRVHFSFNVPATLLEEIDALAAGTGFKRSEMMQSLLENFVARVKRGA